MPTYYHKETGKRFLFVHIPRTAGRFIQENIRLNGYEPEQIIWELIEDVEISHLHRELYEKYLDVEYLEQIAIVRDPVERYISLKSYPYHPKGWFRPQVDYINMKTHLWRFEDGFGDDFGKWVSDIVGVDIQMRSDMPVEKLPTDETRKVKRSAKLVNNIIGLYRNTDIEQLYPELATPLEEGT